MKIEDFLSNKKNAILKRWFNRILETYPDETARFIKKEKDPFANPVGATIWKGIEEVFKELLTEIDPPKVSSFLDGIIRVRAIQNFTPSQAVMFIFFLKEIIREELDNDIRNKGISKEIVKIESKIDKLALISFDIYVQCREKIYQLKTDEVKNRYFRLLQKANLIYEVAEQDPDSKKGVIDNPT